MNTNDQWFEPGDKVCRVADWVPDKSAPSVQKHPQYGTVYCVEEFREGDGRGVNIVSFVGDGGFDRIGRFVYGWPASAFRRVSEIKLCVRAAESLKRGTEQPSMEGAGV